MAPKMKPPALRARAASNADQAGWLIGTEDNKSHRYSQDIIFVVVAPTSPGEFAARVDGRLLAVSRTPLLDAARALLAEERSPDSTLVMRHVGADYDALRARLGTAAKLAVTDNRLGVPVFRRWTVQGSDAGASPVAQIDWSAPSARGAA